jgi:hypothetical protein
MRRALRPPSINIAANDECTDQEQKQRIGEIQRDDNQTNELRVHIRIHFRNELNSQ